MWWDNGCLVPATSYGETTWYSISDGGEGGSRGMRTGGIQGVILSDPKVGGLSDGEMPRQGKNSGKAKGKFYFSSLKIKGGHLSGGTRTVTVV